MGAAGVRRAGRRRFLALGLSALAATITAPDQGWGRRAHPAPGDSDALADPDLAERLTIRRLNEIRRRQGLGAVRPAPALSRAARAHSQDQMHGREMSHEGRDGSRFWERARRAGYAGRPLAENVAYNYRSTKAVMRGWWLSEGHRRNMLIREANEAGIGLAVDPATGETWWTMLLGRSAR